jgi:cholinesterase
MYGLSEDCLTINVIRPHVASNEPLPVGVFIYGGGNYWGGTSDPRSDLTFITSHASKTGFPFLAVSFNFRGSLWGFISGRQVHGTGNANIGLHDQRLALRWIQENIAAFGGDPRKVTIWGMSAGADEVGFQLTAYGGRDDGLFRAAILQSGGPMVRTGGRVTPEQEIYDHLVSSVDCTEAEDTLECLRQTPFERLNAVFNESAMPLTATMAIMARPVIDGDFVQTYGSLSIKESRFVKVPVLTGVSTNEGWNWIPDEMSSWTDVRSFLIGELDST